MSKLMFSMAAVVLLTTQTSYARYGDGCCCGAPGAQSNLAATATAAVPMRAAPTYRTAQVDSGPIVGRTAYQGVARGYGYAPYAAPYFGAGIRDEVNTHNYPDWPSRYSFGLRPASAKANSNYAH